MKDGSRGAHPASQEEWRWVPGYQGRYSVSSLGNVRSHYFLSPRPLAQNTNRYGYRQVGLSYMGARKNARIHRLVCAAFHGPQPEGHEVGHRDGNRQNNAPDNLRWVTRQENAMDMVKHGTVSAGPATMRGEGHARARLSESDARTIKGRILAGESPKSVAADFNIAPSHADNIAKGRAWKHLETSDE